ncbi:MAG: AarF/ABC1/UbiB kinase family protein [Deltaproteobacteria bacterium]|jgi:predicted unusual protein kinase regulating ubiquinone biosynthesis (AarF/ABC1/UbiB family)|nr:AarF/ABC1/UbiB kinase family protein [Deltaproteobacteria bacterium]
MWAFIRLVRASWAFGIILGSYLFQLLLRKMFRRAAWVERRWDRVHARNATRLYRGCVKLRGVFIKMGQVLSIMGTFLPRPYTKELEQLQDAVPPHPYRDIEKAITKSLGKPPQELFARFSETPVAAASLGQVHEATTLDGRRVAVKVLYPNVATIIRIDLKVIGWAMKVYRWFVPIGQLDRFLEQLRDMLERETDFSNEARCIERMAKNFEADPDVLFPEVDRALSSREVLTMSFMDGVKISNVAALAELGLDRNAVATKLIQSFYKSVFYDRFFHADPHPGNFFVQRGDRGQPRLVVLDLGSASEVRDNLVQGMLKVLAGFMARNDSLLLDGIETMGFVADGGDRGLLERTVKRYFEKLLNLDLADLSKMDIERAQELLDPDLKRAEMRALMKSINYPLGWFYVERAVVILFGLSAQLAPTLNTVQVGFPFVMKFLAENPMPRASTPRPEPAPVVEAVPVEVAAS